MALDTGMEAMASTKNNNRAASNTLWGLVMLPVVSFGADLSGGVGVGVSFTDNIFLDSSPNEVDDYVYQASPWFTLDHESPRFDATADYTVDWYRYDDLGVSGNYHRGAVAFTGKAWNEELRAEVGARRSQTLSNPDDVIPTGTLPLSGNVLDRDEIWINPRLKRLLSKSVGVDASYRYSEIEYDDAFVQDNTNQNASLSLDNYVGGRGLTWAIRYEWRRTEYDVSAPWEYQQASGELGVWMNASTRIFATAGKESPWDKPFDPAMEDPFWEAGVAYSRSDNVSAQFAAGERSFGPSWRANIDYAFKRGSTKLSYSESPSTTGFTEGRGTPDILDPIDFDDFLGRPGRAERFIRKRLDWSLDFDLRRTGFSLTVFDEDRLDRVNAIGTPLEDQAEIGVSANLSWQAGVRTEFVASGSVVDQDTGTGNKSKIKEVRLNVKYRLGSRSDISFGYSYAEQDPRGEESLSRDYVSNVASLFFNYSM